MFKRIPESVLINAVLLCVIISFVWLSAEISVIETEQRQSEVNNCYDAVGKNNITYESIEDGYYHAYIKERLVCAHGKVSEKGLVEKLPIPFLGIRVEEMKQ